MMAAPEQWPFPHTVDVDVYHPALLAEALAEFNSVPLDLWQHFNNDHERKAAVSFTAARPFTPACWALREQFASPEFTAHLEHLFGIEGLIFDELGGGLHSIPPGGHLDPHVDFNRDASERYRRVNLLLYLNRAWDGHSDEGALILYDGHRHPARVITPEFNTRVLFACSDTSWHGHPVPHPRRVRRSLAAYYFTTTPPPDYTWPHDTEWMTPA
jgi:Rps23 Pro-64 3,4-dihydroxylase Tpa1-like proline 4-hydroxylase